MYGGRTFLSHSETSLRVRRCYRQPSASSWHEDRWLWVDMLYAGWPSEPAMQIRMTGETSQPIRGWGVGWSRMGGEAHFRGFAKLARVPPGSMPRAIWTNAMSGWPWLEGYKIVCSGGENVGDLGEKAVPVELNCYKLTMFFHMRRAIYQQGDDVLGYCQSDRRRWRVSAFTPGGLYNYSKGLKRPHVIYMLTGWEHKGWEPWLVGRRWHRGTRRLEAFLLIRYSFQLRLSREMLRGVRRRGRYN